MTLDPLKSFSTGGLEDFDETEKIKKEIHPLVKELVKKASKVNVPIHIVICNSMHADPDGVGSSLIHICNGREEDGSIKLPVTFKALSAIAQDANLAMETVLKYLKRQNSSSTIIKTALDRAFSGIDDGRETQGCDPLDCKNCDKRDECSIRPIVEITNEMLGLLGKGKKTPDKIEKSVRIDQIISEGLELKDEEEDQHG